MFLIRALYLKKILKVKENPKVEELRQDLNINKTIYEKKNSRKARNYRSIKKC